MIWHKEQQRTYYEVDMVIQEKSNILCVAHTSEITRTINNHITVYTILNAKNMTAIETFISQSNLETMQIVIKTLYIQEN